LQVLINIDKFLVYVTIIPYYILDCIYYINEKVLDRQVKVWYN
jgi:hypothetical protein